MFGPGSSVGIVTGYGMDSSGLESQWGLDFPDQSRPALEPTESPVQLVPAVKLALPPLPPGKRLGVLTTHLYVAQWLNKE